jgi:hypothetical protein
MTLGSQNQMEDAKNASQLTFNLSRRKSNKTPRLLRRNVENVPKIEKVATVSTLLLVLLYEPYTVISAPVSVISATVWNISLVHFYEPYRVISASV